jgi:hypothetical protein
MTFFTSFHNLFPEKGWKRELKPCLGRAIVWQKYLSDRRNRYTVGANGIRPLLLRSFICPFYLPINQRDRMWGEAIVRNRQSDRFMLGE